MDARFQQYNPCRRPNWRAERAIYLAEDCPQPLLPQRYDDHYVRAYRLYLVSSLAAGDSQQQRKIAICELPLVHGAHQFHFHSGFECRQNLEAWLLTPEPFANIADRFATDVAVIEYYEQLFYCVRDRLNCPGWITKVIRGWPGNLAACRSSKAELQRGILHRTLAYFGGPVVLDALTSGRLHNQPPEDAQYVTRYFEHELRDAAQLRALIAASK